MTETVESKQEEEKETPEMPAHVKTFNPENPPYETQRLCIYLRELEEEKEKEESKRIADPSVHKEVQLAQNHSPVIGRTRRTP